MNYQIEYYANKRLSADYDDSAPINHLLTTDSTNSIMQSKNLKGIIYPIGYRVYEFNDQEMIDHGGAGIKLVPVNTRRRTWWIKIPDDNERKSWLSIFQYACYRVKPSHSEECQHDIHLQTAFNNTLIKFRTRYYYYWFWYTGYGNNEIHRLNEFLLQYLEKEFLYTYLQKRYYNYDIITTTSYHTELQQKRKNSNHNTIEQIYKTIENTINTVCTVSWSTTVQSLHSIKNQVEMNVRQLLDSILQYNHELKESLDDKLSNIIDPYLALKGNTIIRPVLVLLYPYIIQIFMRGIIGFHEYITRELITSSSITIPEEIMNDKDSLLIVLYDAMNDWNGINRSAYHTLDIINHEIFPKIISLLSIGITPYLLYTIILDKFRNILHRACYSFVTWSKATPSLFSEVRRQVVGIFLRDIHWMIKSTLLTIIRTILTPTLYELVVKPAEVMFLGPLQAQLDAAQIPGLAMLMDLPALIEHTVFDITDHHLLNAIESGMNEVTIALQKTSQIVGVAYEGEQLGRSLWRTSVDIDDSF